MDLFFLLRHATGYFQSKLDLRREVFVDPSLGVLGKGFLGWLPWLASQVGNVWWASCSPLRSPCGELAIVVLVLAPLVWERVSCLRSCVVGTSATGACVRGLSFGRGLCCSAPLDVTSTTCVYKRCSCLHCYLREFVLVHTHVILAPGAWNLGPEQPWPPHFQRIWWTGWIGWILL